MALDASIPLQAKGLQLESPMAQAGGLMQILGALQQQKMQQAQLQEAQRKTQMEQQMRSELAALGPNPDQNALVAIASKYAPAQSLLQTHQASADRAAQREQRVYEQQQRGEQRMAEIEAQAREGRITREEADRRAAELKRQMQADQFANREYMTRLAASMRPPPQPRPEPTPIVQTDEKGNVRFFDRAGNLLRDAGQVGKPSVQVQKREIAQQQLKTDLSRAISELEKATASGGLIDQSTGSGAGALVDAAGRFVGYSTPGAVAAGSMAPVYDLVLKMVPRFEGPQSDKDTASYERASGQLANPAIPNAQKKAAATEILRLMKSRQSQFISKDMVGMEPDAGGTPPAQPSAPRIVNW